MSKRGIASRMALEKHEFRIPEPEKAGNKPHGLDSVGENDLFIRVPLLFVIPTVVDKLHLFENC